MKRVKVVVLLRDAAEGVAEQDAKIFSLAVDRGCAVAIGLNKIELLDKTTVKEVEEDAGDKLSFTLWAPVTHADARPDRARVREADLDDRQGAGRLPTARANRGAQPLLREVPSYAPTADPRGLAPPLFFVTQAETSLRLFAVVASNPEKLHFSYRRYVQKQLRMAFHLDGVPVQMK